MIVPDVNLLIYAYNADAPGHDAARGWWEALLTEHRTVGLPWAVACGFIRLMTHPRVLVDPMSPGEAVGAVRSWMVRPQVRVLEPGPRHLDILDELFVSTRVAGGLTTDAHIAAIAIEHQAELHSSDQDFARFPGLRWSNPLS